MMIILNPAAGGGTAMRRWSRIERSILSRLPGSYVRVLRPGMPVDELIGSGMASGETEYIAAGGDGTLNAVLNALLDPTYGSVLRDCRLGAIGLGSSNDAHKPMGGRPVEEGIPLMIDTVAATRRDIGRVTLGLNGDRTTRYFLLNASVGVTAEANWFFNHPDGVLGGLKRHSTPAAILYAASVTILRYRNQTADVRSGSVSLAGCALSNLSILKSTHVSGSLRYDTPVTSGDGQFTIVFTAGMSTAGLFAEFVRLATGSRRADARRHTWTHHAISVTMESLFRVEYDGEVASASAAEFTVMPQHIMVCP